MSVFSKGLGPFFVRTAQIGCAGKSDGQQPSTAEAPPRLRLAKLEEASELYGRDVRRAILNNRSKQASPLAPFLPSPQFTDTEEERRTDFTRTKG